jgi:hypothetical protein
MGLNEWTSYFQGRPLLLLLLIAWSLFWKGLALWSAARASRRNWFVVLLVVNTAGLLEIIYLFLIRKRFGRPSPPVA